MGLQMNQMIELDLAGVQILPELHRELARVFGFPSFYGNNYPALVDCLSSLRFPEDGMTSVNLASKDDVLELRVKNLSSRGKDIVLTLLSALEAVNGRAMKNGFGPSICLSLIG